jgi:hypothetical protein
MIKPKVFVFKAKETDTGWPRNMWVGVCMDCSMDTQYWSWGATMGHMLEHRWIGCEGEIRRNADRRRKYNRVEPTEARLSCGGRTHGVMGEDRGSTVRRADLPAQVSRFRVEPIQEASTRQTPTGASWPSGGVV